MKILGNSRFRIDKLGFLEASLTTIFSFDYYRFFLKLSLTAASLTPSHKSFVHVIIKYETDGSSAFALAYAWPADLSFVDEGIGPFSVVHPLHSEPIPILAVVIGFPACTTLSIYTSSLREFNEIILACKYPSGGLGGGNEPPKKRKPVRGYSRGKTLLFKKLSEKAV